MSDRVLSAVPAAEEAVRELPMPPIAFFLIAFGLFTALLLVTWSFRNTAYKVRPRGQGQAGHHVTPHEGASH
ncbi:MAG TPA: hypothetical protein VFJ94_05550 [Intrasporangium sp.]|uniref:hypothetical protein n=1 Tax=Intrasporangium sp. TaxID=1925024 RepID=UPI002D7980C6|nr:hypothetical protein [Intrasporangium sp.]HET7397970.1 hypothetical protein [Intrasporangium sp.]